MIAGVAIALALGYALQAWGARDDRRRGIYPARRGFTHDLQIAELRDKMNRGEMTPAEAEAHALIITYPAGSPGHRRGWEVLSK